MRRRPALALLVVAALLAAPLLFDAAAAQGAPDASRYLEGTGDPENRVWWYVSLAVLVAIIVAALWFLRVIPR